MKTAQDVWLEVYVRTLERLHRSTVIRLDDQIRDEAKEEADEAVVAFRASFGRDAVQS